MDFTSLARNHTTILACIILLFLMWKLLAILIHRYLTMKATVTYDIPNLGVSRPDEQRVRGTAVICGGRWEKCRNRHCTLLSCLSSIAGLWATRVCADHFEDVLLVEPDQVEGYHYPVHTGKEEPDASDTKIIMKGRTRVSQYTAAHGKIPSLWVIGNAESWSLYSVLSPDDASSEEVFSSNKAGNGKGGWEVSKCNLYDIQQVSSPITQALAHRVTTTAYHIQVYGGQMMTLHSDELKDPQEFEEFFISREGYERVLRSLVLESSERIRCIAGTAIGVTTAAENANRIDSVLIRTPSGGEMSAPAALVIGQSILYQRISRS